MNSDIGKKILHMRASGITGNDVFHDEADDIVVAIGLVFHNRKKEIQRLLSTIDHEGIDYILAIDGMFPFVYDLKKKKDPYFTNPLSTDGSREMLLDFAEKEKKEFGIGGIKVIIDNCVANEFTKRNRYLELCEYFHINYLIIVDSDEYFDVKQTNWKLFRKDFKEKAFKNQGHNVFGIKTITDLYGRIFHYPRCWYNPGEMRYFKNSHYKFLNFTKKEYINNILDSQFSADNIDHIVMMHDHNLRTDQDMEDRLIYQDYLVRYESLVRVGVDPKSADIVARMEPAKHKDNCICYKCVQFKKLDVEKIIDPRPHDQRETDPFAQFRNIKSDNEQ